MSILGGGLPTTLKTLLIQGTFLLPRRHYYPSLEELEIKGGFDSLWCFPLEFYPKLKSFSVFGSESLESLSVSEGSHRDLISLTSLNIFDCPKFVSFPNGGLCAPNLTEIYIFGCEKLKSLPEGMCTLLPSLESLELNKCPELQSFPTGGLPSSLVILDIAECDKLFSRRMEWGLQGLHSLKQFKIWFVIEEVESFPDEAWLPPTLTEFTIFRFSNMKSLNSMGFQHLTSLQRLEIQSCHGLRYLTEKRLPASLSSLILEECPLLKQRCQRDKGKDWPKISHIPFIQIEDEVIT